MKFFPKSQFEQIILLFLVLILTLICFPLQSALAQSEFDTWLSPLNLFETDGRASEVEVVSDPFGVVHVFWAYAAHGDENKGTSQSIYHTSYQDGEWTKPIDVLVSPDDRVARMHSVAADTQGYLHIIWSGGDAIYYSRVFAPSASSASAWTTPHALAANVNTGEPAITIDDQDSLYVVWSEAGTGLRFSRSFDGGETWSDPEAIFIADNTNELARWGRIDVDDSGRLHVALTHTLRLEDAPEGEREDPNYLYYLHSDDQGETWSEPFLITPEPDFGEVNVVTFGEAMVHLVWNGRAGRHGRYHRWSQDGGQTWSNEIEVLAPAPFSAIGNGGLTGFPALVTDATGTLHMVSTTGGGNYYFRWTDNAWSEPILISPDIDGFGVTGESNSLEQPSIALNLGNQLHVVFHDGFERIWHTGALIDAPEQRPDALPEASVNLSNSIIVQPTSTPNQGQQTPAGFALAGQASPTINSSSTTPLLASFISALLLIGIVAIFFSIRRRR